MRVIIDDNALAGLKDFYKAAMNEHVSLDEETVVRKINRLFEGIKQLGVFPDKFPKARYKAEWIKQGCRDFLFEDLHVAYKTVQLTTCEKVVYVIDVCHSFLYHD